MHFEWTENKLEQYLGRKTTERAVKVSSWILVAKWDINWWKKCV